ncbi:MAG: phytanoyl-CoA dioxygenase family protein [candidate division Zixibacteria bacterium]|nr:phytanoyl-CoA dioxygenase family protein [candidate division Zixibacteria bacterium]
MPDPLPLVAFPDLTSRVEALERDGYVYLPKVLDTEKIALLRSRMDTLESLPESYDRHDTPEHHGFLNKCINNTFNRDALFLPFLDWPGVIEIEEAVHGADCHVIGMTAWLTGPGRPDQSLHADWVAVTLPEDVMTDPRIKIPLFITTAHYYLDDLYEALGPTQFVPGSHQSGRRPEGETEWHGAKPQSILCRAGDVVIFRSEVWHRGTANTSRQTRYLLQVHYANRMITQKYPPYLNRFQFDPGILAQATPRQRRLMGEHRKGSYD